MEDLKKIDAQVKVVAAEHDAAIQKFKDRIAELEAAVETERRSREAVEEELAQEKSANLSLAAELSEYRSRAEASLNYITASLLALFGTAVAAISVSRCQ